MVEPGIELGTSWLVVSSSDNQVMRLDVIYRRICAFNRYDNVVCQYKIKELEILQGVYTYHITGLGKEKY